MKDRLGWLLMAPFIIGPIVELGLRLSDGTWHLNAFWVFLLSAMGWLWVWWVVKSGRGLAKEKQVCSDFDTGKLMGSSGEPLQDAGG